MGFLPRPNGAKEKRQMTSGGRATRARIALVQHLKEIWPDILTLAVLGGLTLGLHHAPLATRRTFPVTFDSAGNVVYPSTEMAYPFRGWIIPTWLSGIISAVIPIFFVLLTQIRVRSLWDASNAIEGILLADICGTIFQVTTKKLIGGFRPWFLEACQPDTSLAQGEDGGLNGSGFHQVMYTVDICTNPNKKMIETASTSFPSGHSVAAFAGYGFLFLYWNAKFKVWADHKPALWKIWIVFAPILAAFLISCSLSIDAAHNWYDIVVGIIIGTAFAFATYRMFYAAIWDWRFNHIPLVGKSYAYSADQYEKTGVFTRAGGWGGQEHLVEKRPGESTPRSSTTIPTHSRRIRGDGRASRDRYGAEMV